MTTLVRAFLERWRGDRGGAQRGSDLDAILTAAWRRGRDAWPGLAVEPVVFTRYLADRAPVDVDPSSAVERLEVADLYLACACSGGDGAALAALDERYLSPAAGQIAGRRAGSAVVAEIRQALRERLLIARAGATARLASYTGSGPLSAWVRVAAARVAVDLRRADPVPAAALPASLRADRPDPELALLKAAAGRELDAAFRHVLASLSREDRAMLRLSYLDGLTTAEIGRVYRVSGATVSRRLAAIRRRILDETRALLEQRLAASSEEVDSMMRLARSQLALGIRTLFGETKRKRSGGR